MLFTLLAAILQFEKAFLLRTHRAVYERLDQGEDNQREAIHCGEIQTGEDDLSHQEWRGQIDCDEANIEEGVE